MIRKILTITTLALTTGLGLADDVAARAPIAQALREVQREPGQDSRVYELRTYFASQGKLDELHARFQNHVLRFHERHGITNIGYWVPSDNAKRSIVSLVSYPSMDARDKAWSSLLTDREWVQVRRDSEAKGRILDAVREEILTADEATEVSSLYLGESQGFEIRRFTDKSGKVEEVKALVRKEVKDAFGASETAIRFFTPTGQGNRTDTTLLAIIVRPKFDDVEFVAARPNGVVTPKLAIPGQIATRLNATEYSPIK